MSKLRISGLAAVALTCLAANAAAQDVNIQNFKPSTSPYSVFSVDYGRTLGNLDPYAGIFLNYSSRPLVESFENGDTKSIVDQQLPMHFVGGLGVTEYLEFGVELPLYLINQVEYEGTDRSGVAAGDMVLRTKASFLNDPDSMLGVGALVDVSLPVGDGAAFIGSGSVGIIPKLLVDVKTGIFSIAANVGVSINGATELQNTEVGNALVWGVGSEIETLQGLLIFSGEVFGKNDFSNFTGRSEAPIEGLLGGKVVTSSGFAVGIAAGGGLTAGLGSPEFRTILSLSWAERDSDYDKDGILNAADKCPQDPEDIDGFEDEDGCPDLDNDKDGVPDLNDNCPDDAEDMDGYKDEDGCPELDDDGDGIPDASDQCRREAEDMDGFEDTDGCPDIDNDQDGLADISDKCPLKAEDMDGFKDDDGCPDLDNDLDGILDPQDKCPNKPGLEVDQGCPPKVTKAVRDKKRIKITEKVYFESDKAVIKAESDNLLDQVGLIMRTNPDVKMLEIGGHSDDRGKAEYNQQLSEERAKSVKAYLVKDGIASDRMKAVGYGKTNPIDPRKTKQARARNRRVEFLILEQEGVADEASPQPESKPQP